MTSALPYANGHVHIGHLAGAYLPADTYARYLRAKGSDVAFICGSDEHGVPITITAEKEGTTPQAVIDRYHSANTEAFAAARVEFDVYHRTSDPRHHELTRYFFTRLLERGHIATASSSIARSARASSPTASSRAGATTPAAGPPARAATSATSADASSRR